MSSNEKDTKEKKEKERKEIERSTTRIAEKYSVVQLMEQKFERYFEKKMQPINKELQILLENFPERIPDWISENKEALNTPDTNGLTVIDYLALSGRFSFHDLEKYAKKLGWRNRNPARLFTCAILGGDPEVPHLLLEEKIVNPGTNCSSISSLDLFNMAAQSRNPLMFIYFINKYGVDESTFIYFAKPMRDTLNLILPELLLYLVSQPIDDKRLSKIYKNLYLIFKNCADDILQWLRALPNNGVSLSLLRATLQTHNMLGLLITNATKDTKEITAEYERRGEKQGDDFQEAFLKEYKVEDKEQFLTQLSTQSSLSRTDIRKFIVCVYNNAAFLPAEEKTKKALLEKLQQSRESIIATIEFFPTTTKFQILSRVLRSEIINIFTPEQQNTMQTFCKQFAANSNRIQHWDEAFAWQISDTLTLPGPSRRNSAALQDYLDEELDRKDSDAKTLDRKS